uniref:Uncharacterized protein n=1 Tax=Tanacetum cinerariifolium TaxID=118510 RepID=A0A6L2KK24_TANCI|nr:hypothetical protein [Tanacetum cinerariifolium]
MNLYTFMGLDDVVEGVEISSRKKSLIKRAIAYIKIRRQASRLTRNSITRDRAGAHDEKSTSAGRLATKRRTNETSYEEENKAGDTSLSGGMIHARPILTKSITSAVIYTAADLTSQTMTQSSSEPFDFIRTCRMAGYGAVLSALQGERGKEIMARLKRDMVPTMINNVIYWPLCDFITFRFVPVHLQPLVSNSFSYVWTIYITYMASLAKAETN